MAIRYLYHGTTAAVAQRALQEGLQPRGKRKSNHPSVPSHPKHVYLSRLYASWYALNMVRDNEPIGIVEVDLTRLDEEHLYPDEDFIAQSGGYTPGLQEMTERERYLWARDNVERFQHLAYKSLHHLGNIAHRGPIPPQAITRVALWDRSNDFIELAASDAEVTILNARYVGDRQALLNRWFFEPVSLPEWLRTEYGTDDIELLAERVPMFRTGLPVLEQHLADRRGLQVITM